MRRSVSLGMFNSSRLKGSTATIGLSKSDKEHSALSEQISTGTRVNRFESAQSQPSCRRPWISGGKDDNKLSCCNVGAARVSTSQRGTLWETQIVCVCVCICTYRYIEPT